MSASGELNAVGSATKIAAFAPIGEGELFNHPHEGFIYGVRGDQQVDHDAQLPAAVRGAQDHAQIAGDATELAEQAPGGRLDLEQPRP